MTDSIAATLLLIVVALVAYGTTFGAVTWMYLADQRRTDPAPAFLREVPRDEAHPHGPGHEDRAA
ncbi:hypothetical protein [Nocardioides marmoribigeumensis]|jgi:hypothetical protein|uniref:Uncharacterized protein n=1 Tax=Nocardioides marmoribigeumensis TaxID=433649 RepID=A0ABU2BT43_9ACTN|nr:hypothetical protein [Nocardioides marmoribigeumensis]MDR7360913.1 hypothetical protein [Nocardioides marmoribigeumensis]